MAVLGFGVATLAVSLIALAQLSPVGRDLPAILPLTQQHMDRAAAFLSGPRGRDPAALAGAEREAQRALDTSPTRTDAWLTLAYVEDLRAGRLTPQALEKLRKSYLFGALDPDVSFWRLRFCFDQWTALPADVRKDARRELAAVWQRDDKRADLKTLATHVTDPSGRLAMTIEIALLERKQPIS